MDGEKMTSIFVKKVLTTLVVSATMMTRKVVRMTTKQVICGETGSSYMTKKFTNIEKEGETCLWRTD